MSTRYALQTVIYCQVRQQKGTFQIKMCIFGGFAVIEQVGKRGYAVFFKVEERESGKKYALKCAKRLCRKANK